MATMPPTDEVPMSRARDASVLHDPHDDRPDVNVDEWRDAARVDVAARHTGEPAARTRLVVS
jgi:hypothetical protein